MNPPSVSSNGKEYVTATEFAKRVDSTPNTIYLFLRKGYLQAQDIQKNGMLYLEWASQAVAYKVARGRNNSKGGSGRRKKNVSNPIMHTNSIQNPNVKGLALAVEDNSIAEINASDNVIDLSTINPYDHKDCWLLDGNNEPIRDPDGKPKLNYEELKTKVTVQTYKIKLDKETRSVIPKEELLTTIQGICTVLKSAIDNIPQRYGATLIAVAESITGHEFTSTEHTQVMNTLRSLPKEIFPSIQAELTKMVENVEQD